MQVKLLKKLAAGSAALLFASAAQAAQIDLIKIGVWNPSTFGSGNPTSVNGPGLNFGQKYVIKISYDDASATFDRQLTNSIFTNPSQSITSINLETPNNDLEIFVPMEGLGIVYTQTEDNHFEFGPNSPVATLNFELGSDVSDPSNIIGIEFEGDFVAGGQNNYFSFFNATAGNGQPIFQYARVNNFGTNIAAQVVGTNLLTDAAAVTAAASNVVYSAGATTQTSMGTIGSNDLGAGRSDGEDFLDINWSVAGVQTGADISVGIQNSGLTNTVDTASWQLTVDEEMTGLSDTANNVVSYANSAPTGSLSGTANATGYDFAFGYTDLDEAINGLIANFEIVNVAFQVGGAATSFFNQLANTGAQSVSNADLFAAFGAGVQNLTVLVTDLAGALFTQSILFDVTDPNNGGGGGPGPKPNPVSEPGIGILLLLGLSAVVLSRRRWAR